MCQVILCRGSLVCGLLGVLPNLLRLEVFQHILKVKHLPLFFEKPALQLFPFLTLLGVVSLEEAGNLAQGVSQLAVVAVDQAEDPAALRDLLALRRGL